MIKRVALMKRRPDLTLEQFSDHWLKVHAPLALRLPGLRRYVQNVITGGDPAGYDGMAETWWDDEAAMVAAFKTPEADATRADEGNFLGEVIRFIVSERVIRE